MANAVLSPRTDGGYSGLRHDMPLSRAYIMSKALLATLRDLAVLKPTISSLFCLFLAVLE